MTLRDDVIFAGFIYQSWIYRVDFKRANEYGFAYEREDGDEDGDVEVEGNLNGKEQEQTTHVMIEDKKTK